MHQQPATATPVHDSPWLGVDVTDHLGRPARVRRVYDIDGEHVAVLTSALLSAPGRPATVSGFRAALRADRAEHRLRQALFDQAQTGDRVYLTGKDWCATITELDDNPLRVRLDDVLHAHPHLLAHHPDGILDLSVLRMWWPTLGLI